MVFTSLRDTAELQKISGYSVWHNMTDKQKTKLLIHLTAKA
jgi:hypothetical protein